MRTGANRRREPHALDRERLLETVRATLAAPARFPHARRVAPRGELVAQFILPVELCMFGNARARASHASQAWLMAKQKEKLFTAMLLQHRRIERAPLPGRPLVRAIRFTCREGDAYGDFGKEPIDRLCPPHYRQQNGTVKKIPGLNIISDDRPSCADVWQWCEFAPKGAGFVYLDVHTGD